MSQATQRTRRRIFPHGTAIDPGQIEDDYRGSTPSLTMRNSSSYDQGSIQISDLFVTMCFFARLGFVQPPSCLKCAHRSSRCSSAKSGASNQCNAGGEGSRETASERSSPTSPKSCSELVAWRVDANIPLHPDSLEGNIVFITCDTAKSLVNGDAYPSIRWDIRNKRLLHEKFDRDISKIDRFC